jgi:hypothetical protein
MKRTIKQLILSAAILIFATSVFAQSRDLNSLYYNYKGEEGVVAFRIPGIVMRIAGSIADLDREERQLLKSMKSVQILTINGEEANEGVNFVNEVDLDNLNNGYNVLLKVKDGKDDVAILAREKNGCIKDLVVLVGGDENVMVRVRGRMHSDLLESLAEVSGIEELRFTKEI